MTRINQIAQLLLVLSGLGLLLYPLWGLLNPDSYAVELLAHLPSAPGINADQVRASAAMLWLSNGTLAIAFFALRSYVVNPGNTAWARVAGVLLITYPFVRTFVELWSGMNLTSHAEAPVVSLEFSAEKLLYILFGVVILGISSNTSALDRQE